MSHKLPINKYLDLYSFGSLMPGREYTAQSVTGYRFGFNTQEKDDEIYGKGNTSSAEHWEYDTRLGRRWNVDPVNKPWQSDFACFSNSPISKVDIKGDDDFFHANGSFAYSTKTTTNNIYVISIVKGQEVATILSENVFTKENSKVVAKIGGYYAKQMGINLNELGGKDLSVANRKWGGETQMTATEQDFYNKGSVSNTSDLMNHSADGNRISLVLNNGMLNSYLDNVDNMKSALFHEYNHSLIKTDDLFEHIEVYFNQVTDPSYKNTTVGFKNFVNDNIAGLLSRATTYKDKNFTKKEIDQIRAVGKQWEKKFKNAGVSSGKEKSNDKPKSTPAGRSPAQKQCEN